MPDTRAKTKDNIFERMDSDIGTENQESGENSPNSEPGCSKSSLSDPDILQTLLKNQELLAGQNKTFVDTLQAMSASFGMGFPLRGPHELSDESEDDEKDTQDVFGKLVEEEEGECLSEGEIVDFWSSNDDVGPEVAEKVATAVNTGFRNLAPEDKIKELSKEYKTPSNCLGLQVPRVNEELWAKLKKATRARDVQLQNIQGNAMRAAIPLTKILEKSATTPEMKEVKSHVLASFKLLAHTAAQASFKRRELIVYDLPSEYKGLASKAVPITENLFGDDLPKRIKELSDTQKVTASLISPGYSQTPLQRKAKSTLHKRYQQGGYGFQPQGYGMGFHQQGFNPYHKGKQGPKHQPKNQGYYNQGFYNRAPLGKKGKGGPRENNTRQAKQ